MDGKRLPLLAGAALVAIGVAAFLVVKRAPEPEGSLLAGPVLPGLAERINEVGSLRIVAAADRPMVTLQRSDDGWTVAERDGFPANAGKVRTALLNLAESKVVEAKTANPERYALLGVQDVEAEDATGVRIELTGDGVEHRLVVGNYAGQQGEGTYVRRSGEQQSLMAAGNLVPDREPGAWLQREVTDIASSRIREVELASGDGTALRIYKEAPGEANFRVADVPRGRELQSDVVANGLASTLSGLTLEDVARDDGAPPEGLPLHRASYRMFDGLVVDLDGWQLPADADGNAGVAHVRLRASLDEAQAGASIARDIAAEQAVVAAAAGAGSTAGNEGESSADSGDQVADPALSVADADVDAATIAEGVDAAPAIDIEARTSERLAALRDEVEALNAHLSGWRFRIPAFKFSTIDKSLEDMLAPPQG